MKKIYFISLLGAAAVLFILIQIYFISNVPTIKNKHDEVYGDYGSSYYENIKAFVSLCKEVGSQVILIDPDILQSVLNNSSHSTSRCAYFCKERTLTTFAVLARSFEDELFFKKIVDREYKFVKSSQKDPRLLGITNIVNSDITTHCFLQKRDHVIHLVVLYERTGLYWWHGPLRFKSRSDKIIWMQMNIESSAIRFGKHSGAYDLLEMVTVTLDGIKLTTFRYPLVFLQKIPEARFIECDHQRAQLFYSQYGQDKSNEAILFKQKAIRQLQRAKRILDQIGVRFWMSSGTCLGWFRQCDIIPYSKDVDLGIWIKDYNPNLISQFQLGGFKLKHLFGKVKDSFELSFQNDDAVKLDIFFFYEEDSYMWNGGTQAKTGNKYKYLFPKFHLCWTEFMEMKVRIPCETVSYIEANYGKNWFTPVKTWDWKRSPPNVRENGVWPKEEHDQVIQMFRIDR